MLSCKSCEVIEDLRDSRSWLKTASVNGGYLCEATSCEVIHNGSGYVSIVTIRLVGRRFESSCYMKGKNDSWSDMPIKNGHGSVDGVIGMEHEHGGFMFLVL